jgi:hypothetical protein
MCNGYGEIGNLYDSKPCPDCKGDGVTPVSSSPTEKYCNCNFTMIQRALDGKAHCFECGKEINETPTPLTDALQEAREDKKDYNDFKELLLIIFEMVNWINNGVGHGDFSFAAKSYQKRISEINVKYSMKPPTENQLQEVREKEEFNNALAIEILARFSSLQGRNGSITKTRKEAFIDGALWAKQFTPASNSIKEEVECMGRAKRIE